MLTLFALLKDRCGLSHREAAEFLNVRPDTVQSWATGRNGTPAGIIAQLQALYASIERAALEAVALIDEKAQAGTIELGYASDDDGARQIGWPCVGGQRAMLGLILSRSQSRNIRLVPWGSNSGTAAAADAHGK